MSDQHRYVYDLSEGSADMKPLLGGKGAGVAEMNRVGVPVPDAFTVTTEACVETMRKDGQWPAPLADQISEGLKRLEERTGMILGDPDNPLLVSVRSGAVMSMPGMMDTILNLGISDDTVEAVGRKAGNERFAWDCYRRFIQMYGEVVEGIDSHVYEDALTAMKADRKVDSDTDLSAADLKELVEIFKKLSNEKLGGNWTTDPREQLMRAVDAVFRSWLNPRAFVYRKANKISDDLGTAVNVMQMVFGNRGDTSATGVCFTRNPATGAKELYGEFLLNAQGEDVVSGIRTPKPLGEMEAILPDAYHDLIDTMHKMESHYRDMQDMEFTVENGKLYLLQTRNGKRTAAAALKVARDLVSEGVITKEEALMRIEPEQLDQLLHEAIDPNHSEKAVTEGLPASPGAAVGKAVFDADEAAELGEKGEKVVLIRFETTPDDIHGVIAAQGVLTAHGGMTSHAAVVARGMGKPCVAGARGIKIDAQAGTLSAGGVVISKGDLITLNGSTGEVFNAGLPLIPPQINEDFEEVLGWADEVRRLGVEANADNATDAAKARELGAEGIGLCRTEHMFFGADRLPAMHEMITAETPEERKVAVDKILPMQQADFEGVFTAMKGLPVTVRLLDPPLHEFLPNLVEQSLKVQQMELTGADPVALDKERRLLAQVKKLHEQNPMLGTRGVRLAMLYPEIPDMQARAIIRAVLAVQEKEGETVQINIMIPLVFTVVELETQRRIVTAAAADELAKAGKELDVKIGTMIELPRAALVADQIATQADFFSFGTNDLTQTTLGISRDDAENGFLTEYLQNKVLKQNPFASIDVDGVGQLVSGAVKKGRAVKPEISLGVCGEHGGDPDSVHFFHQAGLDYVSCSPFRVPIARFSAAQAAIEEKNGETTVRDK
ncbi:pyruvate, phosphate dikinase [Acidipropionibacterium jensenii]|uniref:Pyruvate, phosphate dikinase n=5 Tax=Acidipropionibacterium jensenii TaxID=1749 RepID=A0A3S4UT14_9ACTN|nr:pyruvate, phosphate dikinase [Acidipropionibacterium jensenii]AZZ40856.1 pyruvate, phosphate dikinase [Acidipropionibacterium jensenii]MDN5977079.1 pyruvate, phosphate dikinase [Acidipropionibacterium jensenii]MDN5996829.1 pyruvate, phosphate dikinase [Acidipropionibacterium jensenii]MDN6426885.1 pyruvate, phosphate dikinase [Acidipropionibacterium jensenii]MDN6592541.1 pyruvate, phosphate dikinase [Acidipropionibacterium jensenii]